MSPSLKTFEAYDKPVVLERASMQYMWDSEGRKHIDLLGQNLTVSVGHCHPTVVNMAVEQMKTLSHVTTMYYHKEPAELAKEIVDTLPPHPSGEDWVVHLVGTGSEAVDLAIQMARTHTGRSETIALNKAYHGLQGYAAAVTAIGKATQSAYASMFTGCRHVDANDLPALENYIKFGTGGRVACMLMEPLQGYGGIFALKDGYMKAAFEMIEAAGGCTIADEVQTGYGRCGETFWGFQMKNNDKIPDMITMAKGMGNGVGIIGAVVCRRSIAESFSKKMFFNTYGANPTACAAARGVLKVMKDENIMENCAKQGALFNSRLSKLCKELPQVYTEVRGKGLFQGLEVYGKNDTEAGANAFEIHKRLLPHGVVVGRGSAAGNVFRVQPPMCIQEQDVNLVCDKLEELGREWAKEKGL